MVSNRSVQKRNLTFFFLIDYDKEEEIFEEMTLNLRSYFPESWWWQLKEVKNPGNHRYCNYLAR